jgi:hypothetical protein
VTLLLVIELAFVVSVVLRAGHKKLHTLFYILGWTLATVSAVACVTLTVLHNGRLAGDLTGLSVHPCLWSFSVKRLRANQREAKIAQLNGLATSCAQ